MGSNDSHKGLTTFFSTTLWELEPDNYRGFRHFGVKYLQILALVAREFWEDHCPMRAGALSFTTILSLVPFFAFTFAVLKGLGVQNKLEPLILEQVTAGSQEIISKIISYINNTNMTSMGAIGLMTLIITVVALLDSIEEAFNVIWGVRETRSLYRKFSDYLSVVVSAPLLLLAATSITTSLQSQVLAQWLTKTSYLGDVLLLVFQLAPYISTSLALVFLYIFIPNTSVRFKSALIGGVLAGTAWQLAQWGYLHFQVGVARYNAIYGTMAALPVLMVWIYTSWLIVLFGLEVVYAHQNLRTFRREQRTRAMSHSVKELLALAIIQDIASAFHDGRTGWTAEELAEDLDIPLRIVRELLDLLAAAGYLVETASPYQAWQPARELEYIPLQDVIKALKEHGGGCRITRLTSGEQRLKDILARMEAGGATALAGMTLHDLVVPPLPVEDNPPTTDN
jgi:membrane protein